jgi:hypothetical protein
MHSLFGRLECVAGADAGVVAAGVSFCATVQSKCGRSVDSTTLAPGLNQVPLNPSAD